MSCKSAIYAANTQNQAITASGGVVNFGAPVRCFGCDLNMSGGNLVCSNAGYYELDANIGITGGAVAGDVTVALYMDGVAIPGAVAQITTATGDFYQVTIPALFRQKCDCEKIISAVVSGVATIINNAAIVAERV